MKKLSYELIFFIIVGIVLVFSLKKKSPSQIEITYTGTDTIEIKADNRENKITLGQHGIGKFDSDSMVQIGNANIKVGERIEIENTGTDIIEITYNDKDESENKLLLGQNGTGYINKSTPFKMNNTIIQIK